MTDNYIVKKIIKLAAIGFLVGMAVGNLIAIIFSYFSGGETLVFAPELVEKTGSAAGALALQTLMSGLLGAINFGSVILYDLERPPLTLVSIIHCTICLAAYFPIAFYLHWISPAAKGIGLMACIMIAAYMVIWLIMYVRCRIEVRKMNELLGADMQAEKA